MPSVSGPRWPPARTPSRSASPARTVRLRYWRRPSPCSGLLGSVAALLSVRHGFESAVAAALGSAADSVAVADSQAAVGAIGHLKSEDLGRAGLVIAGGDVDDSSWPGLEASATYAVDVIEAPDQLRPALRRLLFKTAIVDDLAAARKLVADLPDVVAVTRDGDVLGRHYAAGGSASQLSLIEVQSAVDEATDALGSATATTERLRFELISLEAERVDAQGRVDVALAKLHESDATMAAIAEELGQYGTVSRSARAEAARIESATTLAQEARAADLAGLAELETRLAAAKEAPEEEPDTSTLDEYADTARLARQHEMDVRLALRTAEERARALHGRADQLIRAAADERRNRQLAIERRARRRREAAAADAVGKGAHVVLARLERSLAAALDRRTEVEQSRAEREAAMAAARTELRGLESELASLTDTVHRDELLRAEHRMRIEQLEQRALEELGLDLDALVGEYGPDQLVPPSIPAPADDGAEPEVVAEPVPYVREEQQRRLRTAERALAQLGRINPLALEEFSALEERHQFLSEQLDDLKRTRRDLLDIVKEVDTRVQEVLEAAYIDVEREFELIFGRLFPGGEGRLVSPIPKTC